MPQLEPLNLKLTGSADGLSVAIGKAESSLGGFGKFVGGLSAMATPFTATLTAGLAAVAAGAGSAYLAIGQIREAMTAVDEVNDAANRLGVTFGELQGLRLSIGEATGVDASTVDAAIGKMQINLVEAAKEGSGKAYDALQRLGLDAGELLAAGPQKSVEMIAQAMQGVNVEAERNKLAFDLLGKSGIAVAAALRASPDVLRDAAQWAQRNLALTGQQVEQIGAANDAWGRVSMQIDGIFQKIAAELAPLVQLVAEDVLGVGENFAGVDSMIQPAVDTAAKLYGWFADLVELITGSLDASIKFMEGDLRGAAEAFNKALSFDQAERVASRLDQIRESAQGNASRPKQASEADIAALEAEQAKGKADGLDETAKALERTRSAARSVSDRASQIERDMNKQPAPLASITDRAQQIRFVAEVKAKQDDAIARMTLQESKAQTGVLRQLLVAARRPESPEPTPINLD